MGMKQQLLEALLTELRRAKGLRISAGTGSHRFIGIWVVVVKAHRARSSTPGIWEAQNRERRPL